MKVLVIGGTRYMGRIAIQLLLDEGDEVTVFSRGNSQPDWWDHVEHICGDRTDEAQFRDGLKNREFDAVLDTRAFRKQDVESAGKLFRDRVGRYLMVSTGSVYFGGKLDFANTCPYRETDVSWANLDYSYPEGEDAYGVGKRHCEKWLQEECHVPYTIIRIPAVMGWDDPTNRMWWWVQRALDGGALIVHSENRAVFKTLYSADAAQAFVRAMKSPHAVNQTYHISMNEIMTVERWSRLIWQAAGHEASITYVPQTVTERLLDEYEPPLSRSVPYVQDTTKAEREFGFSTTPVQEWIEATVTWYRDQYVGEDSSGYSQRKSELSLTRSWEQSFQAFAAGFEVTGS